MIFIDLDATLLNSDKKVARKTLAILNALRGQGVYIVASTGRSYNATKYFADQFGGSALCYNGAYMSVEGKETWLNMLSEEQMRAIIAATKLDVGEKLPVLANGERLRAQFYNMLHEITIPGPCPVLLLKEPDFKVPGVKFVTVGPLDWYLDNLPEEERHSPKGLIRLDDVQNKHTLNLVEVLQRFFDEQSVGLAVSKSSDNTIEIVSKDFGGKDKGCLVFCEQNDIPVEDSVGIGDNTNDLPMLRVTGLAVGVANSVPAVVDEVDLVTDAEDTNGVAEIALAILVAKMQDRPEELLKILSEIDSQEGFFG